ncbi:MAG: MCP four helix bundle domain-containing protein, partial [Wolinella sp.]
MSFFINLSTKAKLSLFSAVLMAFMAIIGFVGSISANKIDKADTFLYEKATVPISLLAQFDHEFLLVRMGYYRYQLKMITLKQYEEHVDEFFARVPKFNEAYKKTLIDDKDRESLERLVADFGEYYKYTKTAIKALYDGDNAKLNEAINPWNALTTELVKKIEDMAKMNLEFADKLEDENIELTKSATQNIIIFGVLGVIIGALLSLSIIRSITSSLTQIEEGLNSFFRFLSHESKDADRINIASFDEFGKMANAINKNIERIKAGLDKDTRAVEESLTVATNVKAGHLDVSIKSEPNNPQLRELATVLNDMFKGLNASIEQVLELLSTYAKNDFTKRINAGSYRGEVAGLIDGVNFLGDEITKMLQSSLDAGKLM